VRARSFSSSKDMESFGDSGFQSAEFEIGCVDYYRFRKALSIPSPGKSYPDKFKGVK
jgi:hypothetical protein